MISRCLLAPQPGSGLFFCHLYFIILAVYVRFMFSHQATKALWLFHSTDSWSEYTNFLSSRQPN